MSDEKYFRDGVVPLSLTACSKGYDEYLAENKADAPERTFIMLFPRLFQDKGWQIRFIRAEKRLYNHVSTRKTKVS